MKKVLVFIMVFMMVVPFQVFADVEPLKLPEKVNKDFNGMFEIEVKTGDSWVNVGNLAYGKFQETKEIDLREYLQSDTALIKVIQNGGGAAYLDAVFLEGEKAIKANGTDGKILNKLCKGDLDITPVEDGIILEFKASDGKGILSVTGRIEPVVIGKEPLQFPAANNYKSKEEVEDFYNYTFGSNLCTVKVDGILDEVSYKEPFVKEFRVNGSGHPEGDLYFWVMNDDENLYVTMDVTPDNTYDGNKDYAKVYVNTGEGIKEFKVSVPETTWGNTKFTYTDKVGYEHKVYEFAIPLSEINAKVGEELEIAFVVYGTLSWTLGYHKPSVAYDPKNNVYFCVYELVKEIQDDDYGSITVSEIYADVINSEGKVIIHDYPISEYSKESLNSRYQFTPSVAYDFKRETFLVTWNQNNDDIFAKHIFVNTDLSLSRGNLIMVSHYDGQHHKKTPTTAYDSINDRFLVVWAQTNDSNDYDIYGRILSEANLIGDKDIEISTDITNQEFPKVNYSLEHKKFLVTWYGWNDNGTYVDAQFVSDEGEVLNPGRITISENGSNPNVSINDSNDMFLVTWEENSEIYGKYVNLSVSGINDSDTIRISPDDWNGASYPSSYYDGTNGMLCVWSSAPGDGDSHARLRYVDDTDIVGNPFYTDGYTGDPEDYTEDERDIIEDYTPIAITGNNKGNNLIAYEIDGSNSIGYRIIGEVESEIIKFNKPDIAYDEDSDLYLSVFEYETYTTDRKSLCTHVYGEIVDNDGTMLTRFPIRLTSPGYKCYQPLAEYDKDNDIFLVVWSEYQGDDSDKLLMACTIKIDRDDTDEVSYDVGEAYNILGEDIEVDIPNDCDKDLDYGSSGSFLLTFEASSNDEYGIYGKIVNTDYNLDDSIFTISNTIYDEQNPKVCFSPTDNAYLVAWNYWYNSGGKVEAQIIDSGGNLKSTAIISEGSYLKDISLNTDNKQFFIITKEDTGIKGQYYDLNTKFILEDQGSKIKIVPADIYANYPVAYNDGNGNMLCTWVDATNGEGREYYAMLQYVDDENSYIGTAFYPDEYDTDYPKDNLRYDEAIIATAGDNNGKVIVAYTYKPDEEYYMLINENNEYQNNMRYLVFGEPSESEPEEPTLEFVDVPYEVQVGETIQAKVEYFDGIEYFDVTNDVFEYKSENPEIATITSGGAITGVAVGKAKISADYVALINDVPTTLTAITTVNVYKKSEPRPTPTPEKAPIGQIIVDDKVIKNIYPEDLVSEGGMYSFKTTKTGDNAKLWLLGSYYKQIANKSPKGTLQLVWDAASYNLPLKSEEVLKEVNSITDSKVNIILEKVDDKELINSATKAVDKLGGKIVSGLVEFSVTVNGKTKTVNIESYDLYVERTIDQLNKLDYYSTTAMKLIKDDEVFTFAPSVFDGNTATIKYRGNGIFAIVNNSKTFSDITNHWSKLNVEKLAARNIAFGKDGGIFAPNDYVTRAEFAVMITRALGITEEEGTMNFDDVKGWYAEDISTAYDAGLINGRSDGKFYPNERIQRKDMAVIIHNALKFADKDVTAKNTDKILSMFTDSSKIDEYAKESTAVCADAGIIMGRDTKEFDPDENATRAEASAIIERMLRYLEFIN